MKLLEGKVALITGAGQGGTGTSMAIRFAAEGAKVAICARTEAGLRGTAARIRELGGEALVLPCDIGDPDGGRDTLVARTEEAFGPIDILVNPTPSRLGPIRSLIGRTFSAAYPCHSGRKHRAFLEAGSR